jgi:hypothetical protein
MSETDGFAAEPDLILFPDLPPKRITRWRSKPVEVEARQLPDDVDWRSDATHDIAYELAAWCGGDARFAYRNGEPVPQIRIATLIGDLRADPGDWIVRGVDGEFTPVPRGIFAQIYEPAGDEA